MEADTQVKVLEFWEEAGKDNYLVHGRAHIEDMCDFAVSGCSLDLDVDDPDLRRLAVSKAREWGVGWVH